MFLLGSCWYCHCLDYTAYCNILSSNALHRTQRRWFVCITLFLHFRVNIFICVLLSWWFPVWTSIQHNCQTPRLGHCLLGSRGCLWHHRSWILPAAQHPNQDGSRVQEGRLKTSWHLCIQSTIEYIKPLLFCHIFQISFLYIYIQQYFFSQLYSTGV